jgi:hypothetical protein
MNGAYTQPASLPSGLNPSIALAFGIRVIRYRMFFLKWWSFEGFSDIYYAEYMSSLPKIFS